MFYPQHQTISSVNAIKAKQISVTTQRSTITYSTTTQSNNLNYLNY